MFSLKRLSTGTDLPNRPETEIQALDPNINNPSLLSKDLKNLLNFKPRFKTKTVIVLSLKCSDELIHRATACAVKEFVLLAHVKLLQTELR